MCTLKKKHILFFFVVVIDILLSKAGFFIKKIEMTRRRPGQGFEPGSTVQELCDVAACYSTEVSWAD